MTAVTHGWSTYAAPTTYLSTELNALAAAARVVGATISCVGNMWMDVEVYVGVQTARTAGGGVDIYILPLVDATNPAYGAAALQPAAARLAGRVEFDAAVTARYNCLVRIPVGPANFQICVENNTGQAFAATTNTVKYVLYKDQAD